MPKGIIIYKILIFTLDFFHYSHIYKKLKKSVKIFCATNECDSDSK
jgi:hypothetical protein